MNVVGVRYYIIVVVKTGINKAPFTRAELMRILLMCKTAGIEFLGTPLMISD